MMNCIRTSYVQFVLSNALLFAILNCSINTIDNGLDSQQKITALTEIESFAEFILEEVFSMKGVVADSDENDHEQSSTGHHILLYAQHAIVYSFENPVLHPLSYPNNYEDSLTSRQKEIDSPPPKSV